MLISFVRDYLVLPLFWITFVATSTVSVADSAQFDGKWNREAVTENGGCKSRYHFKFKVNGGIVKGRIKGQKGFYKLSGPIVEGGTTELGLDGFDAGKFIGVFQDFRAEGTWKTKSCNGTFVFKKKA